MSSLTNLLADLPPAAPGETFDTLLTAQNVRVERIVSFGHRSDDGFWYDQDTSEWVVVLAGAARLRLEGDELVELMPGDFVNIPAHRRHRVEWTKPGEPTVWLAIYYAAE